MGLGVRFVLRTDRRGVPLAYTWVPANEHEYEPLLDLVQEGETVIADKGLWGRAYNERAHDPSPTSGRARALSTRA